MYGWFAGEQECAGSARPTRAQHTAADRPVHTLAEPRQGPLHPERPPQGALHRQPLLSLLADHRELRGAGESARRCRGGQQRRRCARRLEGERQARRSVTNILFHLFITRYSPYLHLDTYTASLYKNIEV